MSRAVTPRTRAEAAALKSDELKRALAEAIAGQPKRFEALCAFHSGLPGPKPALPLASAIGESLAADPRAERVLERLRDHDAAPDRAEVFLPIVAAHAYASRVRSRRDDAGAWASLAALAADEREPVRKGTVHALAAIARAPGGADAIVKKLDDWTWEEDRELRWGSLAVGLDAIGEARAEATLAERATYLDVVSKLAADLADAPRAAERVDARRRALGALGDASARIGASRGEPDGVGWLRGELEKARHPDLRKAFEKTLERLRARGDAQKSETLEKLDTALASSAKPPRDPGKIRDDLRGRGKKHRTRGNR